MMMNGDEAPGIIKRKAMGKPRVAREMDILQTSTLLSALATGEPHVRLCEVVQGLKMCSSWFWLFSAVWSLLLGGQPLEKAVCCWYLGACRRGAGRVALFIAVWDPVGEWETNRLVFLCANWIHGDYTKRIPTRKCCVTRELSVGRVRQCLGAAAV